MIKATIIDDEMHCIKALQTDLQMFCENVEVVATCQSAKEGLIAIQKEKPELVFLDVKMPWINGFEMLEILGSDIDFHVIFTSAYDQFAIKAFKVSAIDYLLKPVDSNDLIKAVDKVNKTLQVKEQQHKISNFITNYKLSPEQQVIAIPNREGYEFVQVNKIIYCKANGAYSEIVLMNNIKIIISKSLGEMEAMLPSELFERIHYSAIVNVQHINFYKKSNGTFLVMKNGDELNVSKSRKENLMLRLGIK